MVKLKDKSICLKSLTFSEREPLHRVSPINTDQQEIPFIHYNMLFETVNVSS